MSLTPRSLLAAVAGALVLACATPPAARNEHSFQSRPPRPAGCDFEVFEEREPPRPYAVVGGLPLSANEWLGAKGRKELLRGTACEAGADAVLLPHPTERKVGKGFVREYQALFIAYTDVSRAFVEDPPPLPQPPEEPLAPGTIRVPVTLNGAPEDPIGTVVREVPPAKPDASKQGAPKPDAPKP